MSQNMTNHNIYDPEAREEYIYDPENNSSSFLELEALYKEKQKIEYVWWFVIR